MRPKKAKLPKTDSIKELAKFFDTHDLTDFEDEFEEVTEPVFVRRPERKRRRTRLSVTLEELGIDRMSIEERIALAQEILDSVVAERPVGPLSGAKKQELQQRLAEHAANPGDVVPWEQIKAEALARFQK